MIKFSSVNLNKTKKGAVQILPLFLLLLVLIAVFALFMYETVIAHDKYSRFKNGLDASNLSVARNVNKKELAETGKITFTESDLAGAFETYKENLCTNYRLDSDLNNLKGNDAIHGQVSIVDFRLYSVKNNKVTEWDYRPSEASFAKVAENQTNIKTPTKKPVEATSVYSELKFNTYTVFKANTSNPQNPQLKEMDVKSYIDLVK